MGTLNESIYETKDKADKRKEETKKNILKKIPKLNGRVEDFLVKINDKKFLKIDPSFTATD